MKEQEIRELGLTPSEIFKFYRQQQATRLERIEAVRTALLVRSKRRVSDQIWDRINNPARSLMDFNAVY